MQRNRYAPSTPPHLAWVAFLATWCVALAAVALTSVLLVISVLSQSLSPWSIPATVGAVLAVSRVGRRAQRWSGEPTEIHRGLVRGLRWALVGVVAGAIGLSALLWLDSILGESTMAVVRLGSIAVIALAITAAAHRAGHPRWAERVPLFGLLAAMSAVADGWSMATRGSAVILMALLLAIGGAVIERLVEAARPSPQRAQRATRNPKWLLPRKG